MDSDGKAYSIVARDGPGIMDAAAKLWRAECPARVAEQAQIMQALHRV